MSENSLEHQHFADKNAEGGRTRDSQEACQPERAGDRHGKAHAVNVITRIGVIAGKNIAGKQEQQAFGQGMAD